jgi:uncharacterized protein (TIGR02246 family)
MLGRVPKPDFNVSAENVIRALYTHLLESWNARKASDYAALFEEQSHVVGFDGSQMNSRAEIETTLDGIFRDHQTGRYVGIIREVRFLNGETAILRAVSGVIPHGATAINPALNSIQTLVAAKHDDQWQITLFQNTPAQFHGRPDHAEALTRELGKLV